MGLKRFDHRRVDNAEIAQLVILYNIFTRKESSSLVFQGGTAIRWCYGGTRFSEDLDFVTSLSIDDAMRFLDGLQPGMRNDFILHFGPGEFSIRWKEKSRKSACYCFVEYRPTGLREKIAIKIELEQLKQNAVPEMNKLVFGSMPAVSYLMQRGGLRVPAFGSIIQVETPEEILSDKVRALLERPYIKGRDFHDMAFLVRTLEVKPENRLIQRKLDMYEAPFRMFRTVEYYLGLDQLGEMDRSDLARTLEQDLSRFVPPNDLLAMKPRSFSQMVAAVTTVFQEIQRNGGLDLGGYERKR
ncbi:MAG: nucleotidyl transferase AbiEii/AbiGii toxin family protein [Syntrophobacteraceae bacterium]